MSLLTSFIPLPYRVAAIAVVVAAVGGYILVLKVQVSNREATIADQRTMINEVSAERDQEKATAEHNAEMARKLAASQAAAVADRAALAESARADRQKSARTIQELQRDPSINDPLPAAVRPYLRRVQ